MRHTLLASATLRRKGFAASRDVGSPGLHRPPHRPQSHPSHGAQSQSKWSSNHSRSWPRGRPRRRDDQIRVLWDLRACQSIVNISGFLYRLFHSRTKSASSDSHVYVGGWLLCYHQPKDLQDSYHHVLSGSDKDDVFHKDLIHCSGS